MANAIYRCPADMNLRLVDGAINIRIRAGEVFVIDDAVPAQVAALLTAGYDIGEFSVDPDVLTIGGANDLTPHNAYNLSDA